MIDRAEELLRFFQWLAGYSARELPDSLLGLMLLYALHTDSDLDAEKIYHILPRSASSAVKPARRAQ